jgi:hypothetical protein
MPISMPMFDKELELYFEHPEHDNVLDIGPGEGKVGKMLRRVQPSTKRIAVDLEPGYVEKYGTDHRCELQNDSLVIFRLRLAHGRALNGT